jgi:carboxylesterase
MKNTKLNAMLIFLLLLITACSSENIDGTIKPGNEGFVIGNGSIGVVLTHGLGASPYEVKELAKYLSERNLTVYAVRLDGHGTSVDDLTDVSWENWYKNYKDAYHSLKQSKEKVFVGGMSLGGALALRLAEDENVAGVISLAPALIQGDERANWAWLFKWFTKYSSRNISKELKPYYYDKFLVSSVAEMNLLAKETKRNLNQIDEPILIMQYNQDYRISPQSSQLVYESVSSKNKELDWINGTGHVFLLDDGKEVYFEKIYSFIKENS